MDEKALQSMTVGPESLGKALGLTRQHVSSLAKDGVLVRKGRGQYPLLENVRRYVEHKAQGANADEWRAARTDHLRVKTEREELALERDRLKMQVSKHDADLDEIFWRLLVTYIDFSDAAMRELDERGLLNHDRLNPQMQCSNIIHRYCVDHRAHIRDRLQEHRRKQLKRQAEEVEQALAE